MKLQTTYKNKTQLHDNFFQSTLLIKRLQRYQKNTVHNVHQFQFWDAKKKITSIFTNKKADIFTMAAFIVISMLFGIYNQKNQHFCRDFYTYKICGNNFITAFLIPVKVYVKFLVIYGVKFTVKIIVIFNAKNDDSKG